MRACSTCSRSDRVAIDAKLVAGVSLRQIIAVHDGLSLGGLTRHRVHAIDPERVEVENRDTDPATLIDDEIERDEKPLEVKPETIILKGTKTMNLAEARSAVGYEWRVETLAPEWNHLGDRLLEALNEVEAEGFEIFEVLQSFAQGLLLVTIIARKPAAA